MPGDPQRYESDQTTHFSIVDAAGDAVSNTYTLNFPYGSGLVAEGTGVLLNNELDDFSAKPGAANAYGLIGDDANAPGPGKRPLSSMSPTLVFKDGELELVTGSPGGSRIISIVLQVLLDVLDHGLNIAEAVNAPRVHDQGFPDELRVERGISPDTIRLLDGDGLQGRDARGDRARPTRSPARRTACSWARRTRASAALWRSATDPDFLTAIAPCHNPPRMNRWSNPRKDPEMSRLWSSLARDLTPYVPGEQPRIANLVKLNTNESPLGPSPRALDAIRASASDELRLYPDPEATRLARDPRRLSRRRSRIRSSSATARTRCSRTPSSRCSSRKSRCCFPT